MIANSISIVFSYAVCMIYLLPIVDLVIYHSISRATNDVVLIF